MSIERKDGMSIEGLLEVKAALEADTDKLELKRAVPEGAVELSGKGRGADPRMLADREKAIPVEGPRPAHKLKGLPGAAGLAKGGHRRRMAATAKPDKHAELRTRICETFHDSCGRCGRRRTHAALRSEGATVSEKVVCRIVAEEDLRAPSEETQARLL